MKRIHYSIFILLVLFLGCSKASKENVLWKTASIKGKFAPPDGHVLLFVGQDKDVIDSYVKKVEIMPAGIMFYTAIQDTRALDGPFDPEGGGIQDFPYLMEHYPKALVQIGLYMVNALDGVIAGQFDYNIEKLAEVFKREDRPIYLRIGYEFDNPDNHYDPVKYIMAYRYIVDKLHRLGVNNVAYVWHSYAVIDSQKPIRNWYPGDDYVDWVAISYFSPYNTDNMNKVTQFARDHGKPLMIAEATPAGFSTDKGEDTWKRWYGFVFKYIDEQNVKAFYINCWWDHLPQFVSLHWGDARIEKNDYITGKWLEMVNQKKFLQDSPELFKRLNYEK